MVNLSPVTVAGSFRHLLIDSPDSWENMKKGSDEEDEYAALFVSNKLMLHRGKHAITLFLTVFAVAQYVERNG